MRVGVLGTFRDSEIDHRSSGRRVPGRAAPRAAGWSGSRLRGLDDDDLLDLLERIAGHEMDEHGVALRDAVLAETAGNPFFVVEILRHLAETGAIYQDADGRWVADADLRRSGCPVSVREVVGRRLAGLGADTERVLGLGRGDRPRLRHRVARRGRQDRRGRRVIDLCDAAVEAAVLQTTERDPDRYTFAHALIEHTLYDGLSPARRARGPPGRRRTARDASPGDAPGERVGELAHHWAAAVQPSRHRQGHPLRHSSPAPAPSTSSPPTKPSAGTAKRWSSSTATRERERRERAEILIGLGDAERQCGVAAPPGDAARSGPHRRAGRGDGPHRPVRARQQPRLRQHDRRGGPRAHRRDRPGPRAGHQPR